MAGALPCAAHDDSAAFREQAARRGHWDTIARELAGAEAALERDDDGEVRAALGRARANAPNDPRVLAFAAALELHEGRAAAADSFATLALERGHETAAILRVRARARLAVHDAPGALADFDRCATLEPGHEEEVVLERVRATLTLLGPAAALEALEARTAEGRWTPARVALAATFERSLGVTPRERAGISAPPAREPRPATPFAAQALNDTLLRRGATWRWFAGPAYPAGTWTQPAYDDGAWGSGAGPLGFGETRIVTTIPDGGVPANRWITTCLRAHFTGPSAAAFSLVLQADYDDGFVAWLNGVEIARRGLPTSNVVWGTLATNHESGAYETIVVANPSLLRAGDNVLAIELHQTTASSSDLLWDAALLADSSNAAITRGPYLQNAAPTAITVRWRTAAPVVGRVSMGPPAGPYTFDVDEPTARTEHEVRVGGLSPGVLYAYSVHGALEPAEPVSAARTFRTPPVAGATVPVRIWAIGDSGYGNVAGQQVRDAWLAWSGAHREDLWLMLGDNAYTTGTDAEYQVGLFDEYPVTLARSPLWSTRGNHDLLYAGAANDYYDLFTLPTAGECGGVPSATEAWYSFDWGPVHFVCLDSEGSDRSVGSPMLQWLRADLAATSQPWVVGFWHHPPYTKGSHDSDDVLDSGGRMRDMRQNVLPILDSLGVDLVLSGHSHSYERSALLHGHYGTSGTLIPGMFSDAGDGRPDGDGAYEKTPGHAQPFEGVVYAVNGSAAQNSGGTLDHPAMIASLDVLGSMAIDVVGDRLEGRFLDAGGVVRDSFVIRKPALVSVPETGGLGVGLALAPARPTPFSDRTEVSWTMPHAGIATLRVYDVLGRRVRTLADGARAAGTHTTAWDGRDGRGTRVPAGAYLLVLESEGVRRARRVVRLP
ncbi:MAG: metallophosphoesterase [Candidatus Eisenbacteria bacterium]|nr:metallophosphoesterase [Candidatus Eisenbacteria bacterium]